MSMLDINIVIEDDLSKEMVKIPLDIDQEVQNPKEFLLKLTGRSRKKDIKKAILPENGSTAKVGKNYNDTLISFLHNHWRLEEAIKHSGSLRRMYQAIKNFQPVM